MVNNSSTEEWILRNISESSCDGSDVDNIANPLRIATGILGMAGCIISIVILRQPRFKYSVASSLLLLLTMADLLAIVINNVWAIMWLFKFNVNTTPAGCKIFVFFPYFTSQYTAWILLLISIERAMAVIKPFQVNRVFSKKRTAAVVVALTLVMLILNLHWLWMLDVVEGSSWGCSSQKEGDTTYIEQVYPWIDWAIANAIPWFGMVACLVLISIFSRRRYSSESTAEKLATLTNMLLAADIAFVTLTFPYGLFAVIVGTVHLKLNCLYYILHRASNYLFFLNHNINFVLYLFCAKGFRDELVKLCGGCGKRSGEGQVNDIHTEMSRISRRRNAAR